MSRWPPDGSPWWHDLVTLLALVILGPLVLLAIGFVIGLLLRLNGF